MTTTSRTVRSLNGNNVRKLMSTRNAIVVDVRDPVTIRDCPIPGARQTSLRQLTALQTEDKSKPVVVIQNEADPSVTSTAIKYIMLYHFSDVYTMSPSDW